VKPRKKKESLKKKNNIMFRKLEKYLPVTLFIIIALGIFGVTLTLTIFNIYSKEDYQIDSLLFVNPLTGEKTKELIEYNPVAIMIENATDIRPQFGLDKASIVYEALVEGGITRLMGIYNYSDEVAKIGPVRSLRAYFLDWALEYDPALFHVGGSPGSLEAIKDYSIIDINEMSGDEIYYDRGSRYDWPHNVYTNSQLWSEISSLKDREIEYIANEYNYSKSVECPQEPEILIDYSYYNYQVQWIYNCEDNLYYRYNGGVEFTDHEGKQITSDKVIVQFVKSWLIDIERLGMQTLGTGKTVIFQNGKVVEGYWEKEDKELKTQYYTNQDELILLKPGKTWIQIIPPLTNINF
jgi:hypothetical protein